MIYLDDCVLLAGWMTLAAAFGSTFIYGLDAALDRLAGIRRGITPF